MQNTLRAWFLFSLGLALACSAEAAGDDKSPLRTVVYKGKFFEIQYSTDFKARALDVPLPNESVAATGGTFFVLPGQPIDGRFMTAAAIDLQKGELGWTNVVSAGGDPKKAEVVAEPNMVGALLHGLLHREVVAPAK